MRLAREVHHRIKTVFMAARININKLLQELRGFAEITYRHAHTRRTAPFCLQMRAHTARLRLPKYKIGVQIELQDLPDVPHPVKITHVAAKPVLRRR
jgi:hypothetical protein